MKISRFERITDTQEIRNKGQFQTYTAFFVASSTGPRKIDPGPTFFPKWITKLIIKHKNNKHTKPHIEKQVQSTFLIEREQ